MRLYTHTHTHTHTVSFKGEEKELLKKGRGAENFSGSNFGAQNFNNCGQNVDTSSCNANGITLIALIITIVIMLILAGITINLTLGENGIFQKAKLAKQEYEEASIKEQIALEVGNIAISNGTNEDILVLLGKNGELLYEDEENDKKVTAINIKGVRVEVSELYDKDVINKYKDVNQGDFINYDAGDWSESQIQNLKNLGLYELTNTTGKSGTLENDSYIFSGFTYRDNEQAERGALKSRNASFLNWYGGVSKFYGGWRVMNNPAQDGYIKIISAGVPENYTHRGNGNSGQEGYPYSCYISEYILTGGKHQAEYLQSFGIEKNARLLDMYENQYAQSGKTTFASDTNAIKENSIYQIEASNDLRAMGLGYFVIRQSITWRGNELYSIESTGGSILTLSDNFVTYRGIRVILSLKNNIEVGFDDDGVVYKDGETSIYDATNDGEVNNTGAWQIQN